MIPVQCRTSHDPERGTYGDCVRACVASILELGGDHVPHFYADGCDGDTGYQRLREWLKARKLQPFFANYPPIPLTELFEMMEILNPDTYYILCGGTADGGDHAVVCRGGAVAHNPAWYGGGLVGPLSQNLWAVIVIAKS